MANRQNTCLLCHAGPFPEERFQGNLAPDLKGAGVALVGRAVAAAAGRCRTFNPATIMPAYYRVEGLQRVAPAFRGKPILSAEQIEDVVAFLRRCVTSMMMTDDQAVGTQTRAAEHADAA